MANCLRFRSGQVDLAKVRVDAGTVIAAGDLLYLDGDDAKPAASFPWTSDLATTQTAFAQAFLGVAHEPSPAGSSAPISVDLSPLAVYEFDCDSDTYEVGGLIGPDGEASALFSQRLTKVATPARAIGRAAEFKASAATLLKVRLASAWHPASHNLKAAVAS